MAKIKQGILGGFSGKVANVVGTSWKGRAVMKSQPLSVANPRTEAQVGQRNKFSKIAELASKVLTQFVQPVENPISGNISGYNLFCKDNKGAFGEDGALDFQKLCAGGGKIINLEDATFTPVGGANSITLTWANSEGISALRLTDKVYAFAIDGESGDLFVTSGTSTRNDETVTLVGLTDSAEVSSPSRVTLVYAVVSADGRDVSVKTYAIQEVVA